MYDLFLFDIIYIIYNIMPFQFITNYNTLRNMDNYIKENNYNEECYVQLLCCKYSIYSNLTNYLHKFICYCSNCYK